VFINPLVTGGGLSKSLDPPSPRSPRPALHSDPAAFAHYYQLAKYLLQKKRGCLKKSFAGEICNQIYAEFFNKRLTMTLIVQHKW
jgi:hypothetical protein